MSYKIGESSELFGRLLDRTLDFNPSPIGSTDMVTVSVSCVFQVRDQLYGSNRECSG